MIKNPINNLKPDDNKLHGIYRGVVEDRADPDKLGRCKIRVYGVHDFKNDKNLTEGVLTEDLPWAEPAMGLVEGSISGFGLWSVPLQGAHVFLFFENSNMMQPRYFASAPGLPKETPDPKMGFSDPKGNYPIKDRLDESDIHRLARTEKLEETNIQHKNDNLDKNINTATGSSWNEPESYYNAKYPDNIVLATHTGITIELDTTPNNQRVHIYHPSNTYIEIDKSGNMVIRNAGDKFDIIDKNEKKHVKEERNATVSGDEIELVEGNKTSKVDINKTETVLGDRKRTVVGKEDLTIKRSRKRKVSANEDITIGGVQTITASIINLN